MQIPDSWEISVIEVEGRSRISVRFEKREEWIRAIRGFTGARWSSGLRTWLVPDNTTHRKILGIVADDPVKKILLHNLDLRDEVKTALDRLLTIMRSRRYSARTVENYFRVLIVFFSFYKQKPAHEICANDIDCFNTDYILKGGLSASYQSQFINALKLFYSALGGSAMEIDKMTRPKKPFQLPRVLSEEEVVRLIGACENIKHRAMLSLIYSAGLRRGELLGLKLTDIDSGRMMVLIRGGKGGRDRIVPLSPGVLEMLRIYYVQFRPKEFLFEGQYGGRYSERSIELVLKKAVRVAGFKKSINLHMLRHSYATHLLESGTHLRYIQELLGHKSARTTQIYTHVSQQAISKIASPFDRLKFDR